MRPSGIVTLITDFGADDAYAGAMKGALLSTNPRLQIVDITHGVAPHDVIEAAWLLRTSFRYFPPGTVHLVVVDPGVGGARRAIAAEALGWCFVAPDNGVLSWALHSVAGVAAVELDRPRYFREPVSRTFHGRDIFAPVAAHLASGVSLREIGSRIDDPVLLPYAALDVDAASIRAAVVHVDRFGNLITNLDAASFERWPAHERGGVLIEVGGRSITGIVNTYSDAAPGELVALFGSSGYLELAVREGRASLLLGASRGDPVTVRAE